MQHSLFKCKSVKLEYFLTAFKLIFEIANGFNFSGCNILTDCFKDLTFTQFFSNVFWCFLANKKHSIDHTHDLFCIFLLNYLLYCTTG